MKNIESNKAYKCPLCESIIAREKWIKITGLWKDREKILEEIKKYKKEKFEIEKKYRLEIKKITKEAELAGIKKGAAKEKSERERLEKILSKNLKDLEANNKKIQNLEKEAKKNTKEAEAAGIKKGIAKEKSERERMVKMLEKKTKDLEANNKKIQDLQRQLKEGKTPQIEGFDYEKEVFKLLSDKFPEDLIKSTGKQGDNIQIVRYVGKDIGSILYECKKTAKFDNSFFEETKRHQEKEMANYAVIITHAAKEGKSKFFINEDVIVIDSLRLLDIAFLSRTAIIEMHQLKIGKEKLKQKSEEILKYMQSGEFRSKMLTAINKSEEAYHLMLSEISSHKKDWGKRYELYSTIHANVQLVRGQIGAIITGNNSLLEDIKELPRLPKGE